MHACPENDWIQELDSVSSYCVKLLILMFASHLHMLKTQLYDTAAHNFRNGSFMAV